MSKVLGIDLGTTNTCAAYVSNKIPRVIPIEGGFNIMPSVVSVHESGSIFVGQAAKEFIISNPDRTIHAVKRLLGRQYHARSVQDLRQHFSYRIVPDKDGEAAIQVAARVYTCPVVLGWILEQVKRYAEIHLGEAIPEVVIAVPAYYSDHQRNLVKRASSLAGWRLRRIVNEPTAAALAYGFNRGFDQRVLVYDMGGGTFDVSILEITGNVFDVVATGGDTFLGGADFDNRICDLLVEGIRKDARADVEVDAAATERIRAAAERAKIELSILANTQVPIRDLVDRRGKRFNVDLVVDRKTLNQRTRDLVQRSLDVTDQVLREKGLAKSDIHELILVGGQTRMPLIVDMLTEHFGTAPRKGVHPDECVALGAALLGDSLSKLDAVTLLDTVSVPIGIANADGTLRVVVNKHASLPYSSAVEIKTTKDSQTTFTADVFQGEAGEQVSRAEYLGTLAYENLPSAPAGDVTITLEFAVDAEGLLSITASNSKSDKTKSLTLATLKRVPPDQDVLEKRSAATTPEPKPVQTESEGSGIKGLVRNLLRGK